MNPSTVVTQEIASIQIPLSTSTSSDANTSQIVKPPKSWTYRGYSRAGTATSFALMEPKWIFDCGCLLSDHVQWRPTCIFITHTHADHIQTLHQILFSQKPIAPSTETSTAMTTNASTIHVYFPAASESLLRNFLQSYYELIRDAPTDGDDVNGDANEEIDGTSTSMEQAYNFRLHPVHVNDECTVTAASNVNHKDVEYVVRIVRCCHRKVCIGYSIFQRERLLIEPYRSMTGMELGSYIKANKENVSNMKEWSPKLQPIVCFLGDTTTEVFTCHPEILQQHRFIAIECTYYVGTIDDERTNIHQHTYWEVLRTTILEPYPNILFLLQHFSHRHRTQEWIQWMHDYNQSSDVSNVHAMLIHASAKLNPPVDNKVTYVSDVTQADLSEPIQSLSVHHESSSNQTALATTILSCNCFLCQPKNET